MRIDNFQWNAIMLFTRQILLLCVIACYPTDSNDTIADNSFNNKMRDVAYVGSTSSKLYLGGYDPLPSVEGSGSFNIDKINGDSSTMALIVDFNTG